MFARIKIYTVHVNPDADMPLASPVFVREGFSGWAFFLGPLWTLYHRLWFATLMLVAVTAVIAMAGEKHWLDEVSTGVLQLSLAVIVGYHANDWRRTKLARLGYVTSDIVASDGLLRAQQRFFDRTLAAA